MATLTRVAYVLHMAFAQRVERQYSVLEGGADDAAGHATAYSWVYPGLHVMSGRRPSRQAAAMTAQRYSVHIIIVIYSQWCFISQKT